MSEAKKVKKQLMNDPSNKQLQKEYNSLMSKHDVERANARKVVDVANKRMRKQAAIKRTMTMTVKTAATSAAIALGTYAVNKYLQNHEVTLNGNLVQFSSEKVIDILDDVKRVKDVMDFMDYFY